MDAEQAGAFRAALRFLAGDSKSRPGAARVAVRLRERAAAPRGAVYARAKETKGRGAIRDGKAVELVDRLDYDFSLADRDTAMRKRRHRPDYRAGPAGGRLPA